MRKSMKINSNCSKYQKILFLYFHKYDHRNPNFPYDFFVRPYMVIHDISQRLCMIIQDFMSDLTVCFFSWILFTASPLRNVQDSLYIVSVNQIKIFLRVILQLYESLTRILIWFFLFVSCTDIFLWFRNHSFHSVTLSKHDNYVRKETK